MADLLPSSSDASGPGSDEPRVIGLDSDAADDLISALSSRTARRVLTALHEDPASPAVLADRIDSSIQNTQYHLSKLEDAGLIEVGDTVYSEKGREMNVYVPSDRALVVVAGRESETTGLKATLSRLLGGVGVLATASLVVDRLLGGPTTRLFSGGSLAGGGADDGGTEDGGAPTGGDEHTSSEGGANGGSSNGGDGAGDGAGGVDTSAESTVSSSTPGESPTTNDATQVATESTETAEAVATSTPLPDAETTQTVVDAADPTMLDALVVSPGLLFFLGGLAVLVTVLAVRVVGR